MDAIVYEYAIKNHNIEMFTLLLTHIDPELYGLLLYYAVNYNVVQIVQILINYGADVNFNQKFTYKNKTYVSILELAVSNENCLIAEILINKGANVNMYNSIALIKALQKNNEYLTDLLIRNGSILNNTLILESLINSRLFFKT